MAPKKPRKAARKAPSSKAGKAPACPEGRRFQDFIEGAADIFWETDAQGRYTYVSPAVSAVLGYSPDEMLGRSVFDFMPPGEGERVGAVFGGYAAKKQAFSLLEHKALTKSGRLVWLECGGKPLLDARGGLAGYRGTDRDVSSRVAAAAGLAASEERCRRLTDNVADAIFFFDAKGRVLDVNRTACAMFGHTREEFGRMTILELESEADAGAMLAAWARMRPGDSRTFSGVPKRKDGTLVPVEVSLACFEEGGRKLFMGVVRDMTARRETERQLAFKDDQLRQAQKMESVGRLAGGIAHEFNNILTGIGGLAQLMKESLGPARPESADADDILAGCKRAAGLVTQLLTFSRHRPARRVAVGLAGALARAEKVLRAALDNRVELRMEADPGTPPVMADPDQLEQVLVNLCLNAADAIAGAGAVVVRASSVALAAPLETRMGPVPAGPWVRVRVADDGAGIAPEHHARVFEPFFTTKPVGQGTGLGLSVVYGIVTQHGGHIDLRSEPGKGTSVDVYFPVAGAAAAPSPAAKPRGAPNGTETVLVAEDDEGLRSVVVRSLTRYGYQVLAAPDGQAAVSLFREHKDRIALALLDVMMPRLEGYQAFEAMAPLKPGLKVLFMSGYAKVEGPGGVARLGLPFIQKPFSPESLAARVREELDA